MKIRIGSRKSDLAQIQSRIVAAALQKISPDLEVEFVFKDMGIDLNLNISLVEAESRGLFTKDLTRELVEGKIDLLVHSWKDLPTAGTPETIIGATLEREDPRDVVFIKEASLQKDALTFLSSSPRRSHNLNLFFSRYVFRDKELNFVAVRGNLPTRLRKFVSESGDALVLALAAVKRLLEHGNDDSKAALRAALAVSKIVVVPVTENPPAPAQGALAIEVLRSRTDLRKLLEQINHEASYRDVIAERERLKDFGGGCHLALGIFQRTTNLGVLCVERGQTPAGDLLESIRWTPTRALPVIAREKFFDASKLKLFQRRPLPAEKPGEGFFLISKSFALPEEWAVARSDVLWAAGLETWKKLREKGHWVSGSQESLGEKFFGLPTYLWPGRKAYKLAHSRAPAAQSIPLVATYELRETDQGIPPLVGFDAFYWSSGSAYRRCQEKYPSIAGARHFCGIGNTYEELEKFVAKDRLFAVLNKEDCLPQT